MKDAVLSPILNAIARSLMHSFIDTVYEKIISEWRSANRKVISIAIWNNSANLLLQQQELKEKKRQRDDIKSAF
jgi:type IV pilus biogenesis protein CpaD/CtpE